MIAGAALTATGTMVVIVVMVVMVVSMAPLEI